MDFRDGAARLWSRLNKASSRASVAVVGLFIAGLAVAAWTALTPAAALAAGVTVQQAGKPIVTLTGTMTETTGMTMPQTPAAAPPDDAALLARMKDMTRLMQDMSNRLQALAAGSGAPVAAATPAAMTDAPPAATTPAAMANMQAGGAMQDKPVPDEGVMPATATQGSQVLPFRLENGVKVFELTAKPVKWSVLKDVQVTAWTFNGMVPGPMIRITEGDRVRITLKNELPDPTSIHWHGLAVPSAQDGVSQPPLSQPPVKPGDSFTYEFDVKEAGTHWYHSHFDTDRQINIGLFGAFIVDPKENSAKPDQDFTVVLNEWRYDGMTGKTYPAMPAMGEPNYFTMNGKAHPDIPALEVKKGDRVRIRLIGAGQFEHPMHLHGGSFKIVATDGHPVPEVAQLTKDTITVHSGERYDIEFTADNPGQWAFHCHIVHHTTNDDVEPGGLMMVVNVQ